MTGQDVKDLLEAAAEALKSAQARVKAFKPPGKLPPEFRSDLANAAQAIQRASRWTGQAEASAEEAPSKASAGGRRRGAANAEAEEEEE
jgi:hypothetical protein